MCSCINIPIGSYGNQVEITDLPPHMRAFKQQMGGADSICIDACLKEEILDLWRMGITTTGCCCGHNVQPGYIGVIDEDIPRMLEMGYEVAPNDARVDSFKPINRGQESQNKL